MNSVQPFLFPADNYTVTCTINKTVISGESLSQIFANDPSCGGENASQEAGIDSYTLAKTVGEFVNANNMGQPKWNINQIKIGDRIEVTYDISPTDGFRISHLVYISPEQKINFSWNEAPKEIKPVILEVDAKINSNDDLSQVILEHWKIDEKQSLAGKSESDEPLERTKIGAAVKQNAAQVAVDFAKSKAGKEQKWKIEGEAEVVRAPANMALHLKLVYLDLGNGKDIVVLAGTQRESLPADTEDGEDVEISKKEGETIIEDPEGNVHTWKDPGQEGKSEEAPTIADKADATNFQGSDRVIPESKTARAYLFDANLKLISVSRALPDVLQGEYVPLPDALKDPAVVEAARQRLASQHLDPSDFISARDGQTVIHLRRKPPHYDDEFLRGNDLPAVIDPQAVAVLSDLLSVYWEKSYSEADVDRSFLPFYGPIGDVNQEIFEGMTALNAYGPLLPRRLTNTNLLMTVDDMVTGERPSDNEERFIPCLTNDCSDGFTEGERNEMDLFWSNMASFRETWDRVDDEVNTARWVNGGVAGLLISAAAIVGSRAIGWYDKLVAARHQDTFQLPTNDRAAQAAHRRATAAGQEWGIKLENEYDPFGDGRYSAVYVDPHGNRLDRFGVVEHRFSTGDTVLPEGSPTSETGLTRQLQELADAVKAKIEQIKANADRNGYDVKYDEAKGEVIVHRTSRVEGLSHVVGRVTDFRLLDRLLAAVPRAFTEADALGILFGYHDGQHAMARPPRPGVAVFDDAGQMDTTLRNLKVVDDLASPKGLRVGWVCEGRGIVSHSLVTPDGALVAEASSLEGIRAIAASLSSRWTEMWYTAHDELAAFAEGKGATVGRQVSADGKTVTVSLLPDAPKAHAETFDALARVSRFIEIETPRFAKAVELGWKLTWRNFGRREISGDGVLIWSGDVTAYGVTIGDNTIVLSPDDTRTMIDAGTTAREKAVGLHWRFKGGHLAGYDLVDSTGTALTSHDNPSLPDRVVGHAYRTVRTLSPAWNEMWTTAFGDMERFAGPKLEGTIERRLDPETGQITVTLKPKGGGERSFSSVGEVEEFIRTQKVAFDDATRQALTKARLHGIRNSFSNLSGWLDRTVNPSTLEVIEPGTRAIVGRHEAVDPYLDLLIKANAVIHEPRSEGGAPLVDYIPGYHHVEVDPRTHSVNIVAEVHGEHIPVLAQSSPYEVFMEACRESSGIEKFGGTKDIINPRYLSSLTVEDPDTGRPIEVTREYSEFKFRYNWVRFRGTAPFLYFYRQWMALIQKTRWDFRIHLENTGGTTIFNEWSARQLCEEVDGELTASQGRGLTGSERFIRTRFRGGFAAPDALLWPVTLPYYAAKQINWSAVRNLSMRGGVNAVNFGVPLVGGMASEIALRGVEGVTGYHFSEPVHHGTSLWGLAESGYLWGKYGAPVLKKSVLGASSLTPLTQKALEQMTRGKSYHHFIRSLPAFELGAAGAKWIGHQFFGIQEGSFQETVLGMAGGLAMGMGAELLFQLPRFTRFGPWVTALGIAYLAVDLLILPSFQSTD